MTPVLDCFKAVHLCPSVVLSFSDSINARAALSLADLSPLSLLRSCHVRGKSSDDIWVMLSSVLCQSQRNTFLPKNLHFLQCKHIGKPACSVHVADDDILSLKERKRKRTRERERERERERR